MNTHPSTSATAVPTPAAAEYHVLPARHLRTPRGGTQHLEVDDPDLGPVFVRWRLGASSPFYCDDCGGQTEPQCRHAFAAALLLAELLLGLHRTAAYEPDPHVPTEGKDANA